MASDLTIDLQPQDDRRCLLRLNGQVGYATCDRLEAALAKSVESGFSEICVDLGGVTHISTIGIAPIVEAIGLTEARGGRIRFVNVSDELRNTLGMLGMMLEVLHAGDQPPTAAVLVVDDDAAARDVVRLGLESQGLRVLQAQDAAEAIGMLQAHPEVLVIITDWCMPGRDGIDLLSEVRAKWPWIERVLLTGVTLDKTAITALQRGTMSRIVTKPWDLERMTRTVEALQAEAKRKSLRRRKGSARSV